MHCDEATTSFNKKVHLSVKYVSCSGTNSNRGYLGVTGKDSSICRVCVLLDPTVLIPVFNQLVDRSAWSGTR